MTITGFSNERTSEYMILNDLYDKFKPYCKFFYPFYFHKNRDDTLLSLKNDLGLIQVVACFARRPKTNDVLSNKIIISFRKSIFDQANHLLKHNFPIIVGSPLGTKIIDISFGSRCQWFQIDKEIFEDLIEVKYLNDIIDSDSLHDGIRLLSDEQLSQVLFTAPKYSWQELIEFINIWNEDYNAHYYSSRFHNLFNSVSGFKPLFIVYKLQANKAH